MSFGGPGMNPAVKSRFGVLGPVSPFFPCAPGLLTCGERRQTVRGTKMQRVQTFYNCCFGMHGYTILKVEHLGCRLVGLVSGLLQSVVL